MLSMSTFKLYILIENIPIKRENNILRIIYIILVNKQYFFLIILSSEETQKTFLHGSVEIHDNLWKY